jgi:hypothetical protein
MTWRTRSLAAVAVVVAGCSDPYYVSLGGNAAELASDAGVTSTCASDEGTLVPGSSCEPLPDVDRCETSSPIVSLAGDCAARALVPCPPLTATTSGSLEQDALDVLLTSLLRSCGQVNPNVVRARFEAGCATSFAMDFAPGGDAGDPIGDCVARRLGAERYACAESIGCGVGEVFGVPTSSVEPGWL